MCLYSAFGTRRHNSQRIMTEQFGLEVTSGMNESIIPNLQKLQQSNQFYKYSDLCRNLNLPLKSGKSKQIQLDKIQNYCDMTTDKTHYPTLYKIDNVYPDAFILYNSSTYQYLFEAAIYQAFLSNDSKPLYLTNIELLKLFQEVNDNFAYSFNREKMAKISNLTNQDYNYMVDISQVVYKILRRWTMTKIDNMFNRHCIDKQRGYRLYSLIPDTEYYVYHNVHKGSEIEKWCMEIYNQAIRDCLPKGWDGEWVGEWQWENFQRQVRKAVKEKSNEDYVDLKPIMILSPATEVWMKDRLMEIYHQVPGLDKINKEACHKILVTSQLDKHSMDRRKEYIDINMAVSPNIKFRDILYDKNKKNPREE